MPDLNLWGWVHLRGNPVEVIISYSIYMLLLQCHLAGQYA
jgi:hypothetical protein